MLENASVLEFFENAPNLQARYPRTDTGELGWLPAVDVLDADLAVVVRAALPGVGKDEIEVEVSSTSLTVRGRRSERQGGRWVRQEVLPGPFSRTVSLPHAVQADEAQASHKDGILEIVLPKVVGGTTQTLKIQ